jgi:Sel1 repeat/Domain of unknown function (DUF4124)/Domain of unknown function (DUF4034)
MTGGFMKRLTFLAETIIILLLLVYPQNGLAVYKWIDENGTMHISDTPRPQSLSESSQNGLDEGKDIGKVSGASIIDGPVARNKLERDVKELFCRGKFDELEKIAKDLRKTKARFPEGHWKLYYFYNGLSSPKNRRKEQWDSWLLRMEKWQRAYPNSVTARVAAADSWYAYGWEARGNGYANTVSEEASKILADSVNKAFILANKAPADPRDDCPERYHLLLRIGRTEGWDRQTFTSALDRAIKFEPQYYWYYGQTTVYLEPRWYGQEGEWISFADTADILARRAGNREIYTRLLIPMWQNEWQNFDDVTISWEKMKKGFYDMERDHPNSPYNLNELAKFACLAKDKEAAKAAFAKIKNKPYLDLWANSKIDFDTCRAWALGDDVKSKPTLEEIYQSGSYQEVMQFRKLAEDGDVFSQNWLGEKYRRGEFGKQDYVLAFKWFKMAAEKGYASAQVSLGDMYGNGEGLKKDESEAFKWYQRAALQNDENAKLHVAMAYEQGIGTTKNLVKAFAWMSNLNNTTGIASINTIRNELSTEERTRAMEETLKLKDLLETNTCN